MYLQCHVILHENCSKGFYAFQINKLYCSVQAKNMGKGFQQKISVFSKYFIIVMSFFRKTVFYIPYLWHTYKAHF